jgi:hypothetical protein
MQSDTLGTAAFLADLMYLPCRSCYPIILLIHRLSSPISTLHKNIILTTLLPVNPVGRKIPSVLLFTTLCAYVHRLTLFSSQAARRDQNRIAQREFRLRKQQRVIPSLPSGMGSA